MSDLVQKQLADWAQRGDRRAGGEALDAIAREGRWRVRNFLVNPDDSEVEDVLSDALTELCLTVPGKPARALAPEDAENPAAWRRKVLKNYLIDRSRKTGRRRHAEQGLASGLSPAAEAAQWRERGAANTSLSDPLALSSPEEGSVDPRERIDLGLKRDDVLAVVGQLVIRRRVLVMLVLGADPIEHAAELADELEEAVAFTRARIARALRRSDEEQEGIALEIVRVVWPTDEERKARENARKNLSRAVADLQGMLGVGS